MTGAEYTCNPALLRARYNLAQAEMNVLVEEVSDAVQRRMDANIAEATGQAAKLRHLAGLLGPLMTLDLRTVDNAPLFFVLCESLRALAGMAPAFEAVFEDFVTDHGAQLETAAQKTIWDFLAWLRQQEQQIGPLCDERAGAYSRGLAEAAEEHSDLRAELAEMNRNRLARAFG